MLRVTHHVPISISYAREELHLVNLYLRMGGNDPHYRSDTNP